MIKTEERLRTPKLEELSKVKAKLDQQINDGADPELTEPEAVLICDALEWIITMISNRRDYHRQRSLKSKFERKLLEEALRGKGVDLSQLTKRAHDLASDELIDTTSDTQEERPHS